MAEFQSFEAGTEVIGDVLMAFVAGFPQEAEALGRRILEKHGLSTHQSGRYYPLQSFLDAMKEISDSFSSQMLFRIGEQIALHAVLPPAIADLQMCLSSIDTAYHMNHRGGEIGTYDYQYLGKDPVSGLERARMVCRNPYPCAFDRGVIEGFVKRFKPAGSYDVVVRHDDSEACRQRAGESCTFIITWC